MIEELIIFLVQSDISSYIMTPSNHRWHNCWLRQLRLSEGRSHDLWRFISKMAPALRTTESAIEGRAFGQKRRILAPIHSNSSPNLLNFLRSMKTKSPFHFQGVFTNLASGIRTIHTRSYQTNFSGFSSLSPCFCGSHLSCFLFVSFLGGFSIALTLRRG